MSILAIIQNPQNEAEEAFSIPIATESVFKSKWEPIVEELHLQWLPLLTTGMDIEKIDLEDILNELDRFKSRYVEKYGADEVVERVDLLIDSLPSAFERADVTVFIG